MCQRVYYTDMYYKSEWLCKWSLVCPYLLVDYTLTHTHTHIHTFLYCVGFYNTFASLTSFTSWSINLKNNNNILKRNKKINNGIIFKRKQEQARKETMCIGFTFSFLSFFAIVVVSCKQCIEVIATQPQQQ